MLSLPSSHAATMMAAQAAAEASQLDILAVSEFVQNRDYNGYVRFLKLKPNEAGCLKPKSIVCA